MITPLRKQLRIMPDIEPFINADETYKSEIYSIETLKIPSSLLMENAGMRIADLVFNLLATSKKHPHVLIFSGIGNNGGDALVCARHLIAQEIDLSICLLKNNAEPSFEQRRELTLIKNLLVGQQRSKLTIFDNHYDLTTTLGKEINIIVDGIFGAGLNRPPAGIYEQAILKINELKKENEDLQVVSIDVPSGLTIEARPPMGACVTADYTMTFGKLKRCHVSEPSKKWAGKSIAEPIGLFYEKDFVQLLIKPTAPLIKLMLPLAKENHKGAFGHVAVFEGVEAYKGACRLSAKAALRSGAGLVYIITNESYSDHPSDLAEFIKINTSMLDENFLSKLSSLVIGPGLGSKKDLLEKADDFLRKSQTINTIVLDADGLRLLNEQEPFSCPNLILTPHPKEAARLLGVKVEDIEHDRFSSLERLASLKINRGRTIWVLKGATTLVHDDIEGIFAFEGDIPLLAVGGSGDVLAGLIAGLIAQTPSPLLAVLIAIQLSIKAAHHLSKHASRGIFPSELTDCIPSLLKRPLV